MALSVKLRRKTPDKDKIRKLNDRQRIFVSEYLVDYDATRAAKAAGYRNPGMMGSQLVKRNKTIIGLIGRAHRRNQKMLAVDRDRIIQELSYISLLDPAGLEDEKGKVYTSLRKMPEHVRRAVKSFKIKKTTDKEGNVTQEIRIMLWDKLDGLKTLMKHLGLFSPQQVDVNVQGNINVQHMLPVDELDNILREHGVDPVEIKKQLIERLRERKEEKAILDEHEKEVIDVGLKKIESESE